MTEPNFRDVELLSAYLDEKLPQADSVRLESRLLADPELAAIYQDLSQARSILRRLPQRRAPRNFMLSAKKAGVRPPLPRAYPVLRFASGFAAALFFITLLGNFVGFAGLPAAQAPMLGAAPAADMARTMESTAATEAPSESFGYVPALPTQSSTPELGIAAFPTEPPEAATPAETTAAARSPIAGWQAALLGVAVVLGGSAFFIRWRTDREFRERDPRQKPKP
jgi:anti-sigma factor RsiW